MSESKKATSDAGQSAPALPALNRAIRGAFRAGVLASFAFMLVGLVLHFAEGNGFQPFSLGKAVPWTDLPAALAGGQPLAILSAGVVLLLITPVAGLVAAAIVLAGQKESAMAAVTVAVLAILATSVALAR